MGCLGCCDHKHPYTPCSWYPSHLGSFQPCEDSPVQQSPCKGCAALQSIQTFRLFPLAAFQSIWKLNSFSKTTDWLTVWDIVFSVAFRNAVVWPKIKSPRNHTWFTTQLFDNIKIYVIFWNHRPIYSNSFMIIYVENLSVGCVPALV